MTAPTTSTPTPDRPRSPSSLDLITSSSDGMTSVDLLSSVISRSLLITEDEDSGDEIVWNVSEQSSSSENEHGEPWEDDFILISRSHSPPGLTSTMEEPDPVQNGVDNGHHASITRSVDAQDRLRTITVRSSSKKKQPKDRKKEPQQPEHTATNGAKIRKKKTKKAPRNVDDVHPFPEPLLQVSRAREFRPLHKKTSLHPTETKWFEEMALVKFTGLGARPVVDDYSDGVSVVSADNESVSYPTIYEEASTFISSFLSNPEARNDTVCRLTLLQSLIIELGLATASLPESLSAATAFLKSRAFLNIRDYLAVREQGPEAVQRVLYPSKSALIKDIKKTRNRASLKWVKQHGLQVFLVGWTHH